MEEKMRNCPLRTTAGNCSALLGKVPHGHAYPVSKTGCIKDNCAFVHWSKPIVIETGGPPKEERPPLEIMPERIWLEKRWNDLHDAIERAKKSGLENHMLMTWINERNALFTKIESETKVPEPVVEVGDVWLTEQGGLRKIIGFENGTLTYYRFDTNTYHSFALNSICIGTKLTAAEARPHILKAMGLEEEWVDSDARRCHNCDLYFAHDSKCQECCATKNGEIKRGNWRPKAKEAAK